MHPTFSPGLRDIATEFISKFCSDETPMIAGNVRNTVERSTLCIGILKENDPVESLFFPFIHQIALVKKEMNIAMSVRLCFDQ